MTVVCYILAMYLHHVDKERKRDVQEYDDRNQDSVEEEMASEGRQNVAACDDEELLPRSPAPTPYPLALPLPLHLHLNFT